MTMEFEIVAHDIGGVGVKFVLPKHAHDSYLDALRRAPIPFSLMGYFGHIEQRLNRKLRVVDVGANLGTIALPLAVRGNDVVGPAKFISRRRLEAPDVQEQRVDTRTLRALTAATASAKKLEQCPAGRWHAVANGC